MSMNATASTTSNSSVTKSSKSRASTECIVAGVVRRMLAERSLDGTVSADADLRDIGLTSMDMVDLVLSIESALDVQIPEAQITPANFRTIAAISALAAGLQRPMPGVQLSVTNPCQA